MIFGLILAITYTSQIKVILGSLELVLLLQDVPEVRLAVVGALTALAERGFLGKQGQAVQRVLFERSKDDSEEVRRVVQSVCAALRS